MDDLTRGGQSGSGAASLSRFKRARRVEEVLADGLVLRVRELTLSERDALDMQLAETRMPRLAILAATLSNKDGSPLFEDYHTALAEGLGDLPAATLERVFERASSLNGIGDPEQD